ncbi:hypothetical protein OAC17_01050 [Flavobacteriaceae bacterium]|nr:hypothetical protein [Flavobacteriaceae bacterium]
MKSILESTQLETSEKTYIVDLVQQNNSIAVEIIQNNVTTSDDEQSRIKIASSLLSELIKTLKNYHAKLPTNPLQINEHLSELDKQSIERNYLRGVPLKNLALQFDQSTELIERVLRNRGIEIVDNALPKTFYSRRKGQSRR